jgi:hypothetical protein
MVYVRDRTVWQYKVVTRDVPLSPSEAYNHRSFQNLAEDVGVV